MSFDQAEGRSAKVVGFTLRNGWSIYESGGVNIYGSPTLEKNTISSSFACGRGAGIMVWGGAPLIYGNRIQFNGQIPGCSGGIGGGGISLTLADGAELIGNVIAGNRWETSGSSGGGGVAFWISKSPLLIDNLIVDNYSANDGGGLYMINDSSPILVQNILAGNEAARRGGGGYWSIPTGSWGPLLIHNTLADNRATEGSAIYHRGYGNNDVEFIANVMTGATSASLIACALPQPVFLANDLFNGVGPLFSGTCTDVSGTSGNLDSDPLFLDAELGDFRLRAESPAIDAGLDGVAFVPATDFAGLPRVVDGNRDGLARIDMGAFEYQPALASIFADAFETGGTGAWSETLP